MSEEALALELGPDDWQRLERLRAGFLGGGPRRSRWTDARDLELYDATFGRRIAWKWRAVLGELVARGWRPPAGELLDFGCGTGVAGRELLAVFGAEGRSAVRLHDAFGDATAFAAARLRAEHPLVDVRVEPAPPRAAPALLLASHVLNELRPAELDALAELARGSAAALFVEPGEREASRLLSELRDRLRDTLRVVAPCTHSAPCGALARERDWCHLFARPPAEAHQDRGWSELARRLAIDLRALPYSFLLVERAAPEPPSGLSRVVGRPRHSKADARFDACDARGLHELTLRRRDDRELHRELAKPLTAPLVLRIESRDGRVLSAERAEPPPE